MFGSLGGAEILLVMVLALLLFGPRKLPQIGQTMGRAMAEFRRATHDLKTSLEHEVATEELREAQKSIQAVGAEVRQTLAEVSPAALARGSLDGHGASQAPAPSATPAAADGPAAPAPPSGPEPDDRTTGQS
jgi:Tat protein translocase TatB subunit